MSAPTRRRRSAGRGWRLGLWLAGAALVGAGVWLLAHFLERRSRVQLAEADDLCAIFAGRRGWYESARRAAEEWGVSEAVQLAVIYQESRFEPRARPRRRRILWIFPGTRYSSAFGYGQVVDATWDEYRDRRGRDGARRHRFPDVVDFVGWYVDQIHRRTGIAKDDPYRLYLAYHEGPAGYRRGTHVRKPWLLGVASEVELRARRYEEQHEVCKEELRRSARLVLSLAAVALLALAVYLGWRYRRSML